MDHLLIAVAFILGLAVRQVGLPPMLGYLAAGFLLNWFGFEGGEQLQRIADLGVTLLLFSIGLKLDLKSLARPEVWAGATIHATITVLLFGIGIFGLSATALPYFSSLTFSTSILLAFALSFSSTVFAIKILEEKGEIGAMHGRVAIGILIMQDIFAVLFLTFSLGKLPSLWAILIPAVLWMIRPLLFKVMTKCGHGELLLLFGLFAALVIGASGFELVGLKADLGALILGVLLAKHDKSSELAKVLMGFKDLLLVGFFLTIGLAGAPSLEMLGIAAICVIVMPLKVVMFYLILTRFKLRARSSLLGSFSLANYSEFGLIVAAVGASNGWITSEWLIIIALALSATFVIASPLNTVADTLYVRYKDGLQKFETDTRHPDDQPIYLSQKVQVAVFGMGRLGTRAFDFMFEQHGNSVIGIDHNNDNVVAHRVAGRRVIYGDPTDPDFWIRVEKQETPPELVMLALSKHQSNIAAAKLLLKHGYSGSISAVAHFDDQADELRALGVHAVFNFYNEAGLGFAEHSIQFIEKMKKSEAHEGNR